MNKKNTLKAWTILGLYIIATCALLLFGYGVQKPALEQQEFPFTITYSYQGHTETISGIYVAEYYRAPKYIGDDSLNWFGYIKDHDRLQADFYCIAELENQSFSIDLELEPGYLMGDPNYADSVCQPGGKYICFDDPNYIEITDPAELEAMGFSIVSWEYPKPIENHFSFGGISMSSEATIFSAILAVIALLASMVMIRRVKELTYGMLDKFSVILNFLVAFFAFPFILVASALSEIVADASTVQQLLYLAPALTALGLAASVTLRRMGHKHISFWIQFAGPTLFALTLFIEDL